MRIEGSYTVAAPAEQVYSGLIAAETLARAIPGCERLIQFGPAEADGAVTFEARICSEALEKSVWSVRLRVHGGRRHDRVEMELRVIGAAGAYTGSGAITLIRRDGRTLLSYSAEVDASDESDTGTTREAAMHELARGFFEGLEAALREPMPLNEEAQREGEDTGVDLERVTLRGAGQRAAWMVGGLLVGVAALALLTRLARRNVSDVG